MTIRANMKMVGPLVLVGLLGCSLGLLVARGTAFGNVEGMKVAHDAGVEADAARLKAIELRLDDLSRRLATVGGEASGNRFAGRLGQGGMGMPQKMALQQLDDGRAMLALAARFNATPRDPQWATSVEASIKTALSDPSMKMLNEQVDLQDVDCRSDICKIVAQFPERGAALDWTGPLLMQLSGSLPAARLQTVQLPYGGVELRMYLVPEKAKRTLAGTVQKSRG